MVLGCCRCVPDFPLQPGRSPGPPDDSMLYGVWELLLQRVLFSSGAPGDVRDGRGFPSRRG